MVRARPPPDSLDEAHGRAGSAGRLHLGTRGAPHLTPRRTGMGSPAPDARGRGESGAVREKHSAPYARRVPAASSRPCGDGALLQQLLLLLVLGLGVFLSPAASSRPCGDGAPL